MLPRQVSAMITDEQGRLLDQLADERQLSVSAIVREAIRDYLAAAPNTVAAAR
jgi:predicted transcriptional regulator